MMYDILTGMLNLKYEAWINMHEYVCMDDYIYAISIIACMCTKTSHDMGVSAWCGSSPG